MKIENIDIIGRFTGYTDEQLYAILEQEAKKLVGEIQQTIPAVGIKTSSTSLQDAVKYEQVDGTSIRIYVDEKKAPYFKYLEDGTPAHDIMAKNGGSLRFADPNNKYGQGNKDGFAYFKKIRHPGTRAYAPFSTAVQLNRESIIKRIKSLNELVPGGDEEQ